MENRVIPDGEIQKYEKVTDEIVDNKALEIDLEKSQHETVKANKIQFSSLMQKLGFREETETETDANIPELSYLEVLKMFLWFGMRAFGGPVAQIALMKQELVIEKKWISVDKFNRVYAVYQILPGPEATELACYFGYLAKGRVGAFLGGLGFLLPGVGILLIWSYLYVTYGIEDDKVQASFRCVQVTISAIIFRATFKLADAAIMNKDKTFNWDKGFLCLLNFLSATIGINFFISLGVSGVINYLFNSSYSFKLYLAYFLSACLIGFYVLYVQLNGLPNGSLIGGNIGPEGDETSYGSLLSLGLVAGCVTFGGAYTTLPFIYSAAVVNGKWLTNQEFLDAIAITNVLPTPLVSFVTMVGWIGHGVGGSILMTIGIFLPAFSFTIIGHEFFEMLVHNVYIESFLDGIASAVIGLLMLTAFQFVKNVIVTGIDAVVFFLAFYTVFYFTDKFTQPIVIAVAAIVGQTLYK